MRLAPKRAAAKARIPEPVPRSSSENSDSGERTRLACSFRRLAKKSSFGRLREARNAAREGACAPQKRVHRSSKPNDIAVVACSPVPKAAPAGMSKLLSLFLLRFLFMTDR